MSNHIFCIKQTKALNRRVERKMKFSETFYLEFYKINSQKLESLISIVDLESVAPKISPKKEGKFKAYITFINVENIYLFYFFLIMLKKKKKLRPLKIYFISKEELNLFIELYRKIYFIMSEKNKVLKTLL